jgi:hypothetical protein
MALNVSIDFTCCGCKKRIKHRDVKIERSRRGAISYVLEGCFVIDADNWDASVMIECRPTIYDSEDADELYCSMHCLLTALPKALLKVQREANKEAKEDAKRDS